MIAVEDPREAYLRLMSAWDRPGEAVRGDGEKPTIFSDPSRWPRVPDTLAEDRFLDTVSYLPDDILVKVDRASMAVSLEARVPMLDHRLVELAWRLPRRALRTNGTGKVVLRGVLDKHVPRDLVDRPKMGFALPLGGWLRGPLRDWAGDLLSPDRLRREGFFHVDPIERCWREHVEGHRDWKHRLWNVLMFQAWLERR
jgi:asparagine synthase (glutamine-hydrolysing)